MLFAACLLPAQLQVTYELQTARDRVRVSTINDLGFQYSLGRFMPGRAVPDLTPILPVVLKIQNTGTHAIGYVNVRYTYTLPDGDHAGDVTYARNPHMGDQFEPRQEILMYPAMDAVGNHRTAASQSSIEGLVDLMRRCSKISISLDAITWDDGTIEGPDRGGIAQKYRGEREAILAAYAEAERRPHPVPADDFTYKRALEYSKGNAATLREMLDKFAPLKGELQ